MLDLVTNLCANVEQARESFQSRKREFALAGFGQSVRELCEFLARAGAVPTARRLWLEYSQLVDQLGRSAFAVYLKAHPTARHQIERILGPMPHPAVKHEVLRASVVGRWVNFGETLRELRETLRRQEAPNGSVAENGEVSATTPRQAPSGHAATQNRQADSPGKAAGGRKRGRPRVTGAEHTRLVNAWGNGHYPTYQACANALGGGLTAADVRRAVDREKKRRKRLKR